jgi:hypothetical protein
MTVGTQIYTPAIGLTNPQLDLPNKHFGTSRSATKLSNLQHTTH